MHEGLDYPKHWEIVDRLYRGEELLQEIIHENLVVASCRTLIARLMKGSAGGITYWAVGAGDASWDTLMPSPEDSDVKLYDEIYRKAVAGASISYIDATNAISATPTSRLQVTTTFLEGDFTGTIREMALFGGDASVTKDSGFMLNRRIHVAVQKDADTRLERLIRMTF